MSNGVIYVYDPVDHSLSLLPNPVSPTVAGEAGASPDDASPVVRVHLVGHLPAIAPLYGAWSREACLLEAGYIESLLMAAGAAQSLSVEAAPLRLGRRFGGSSLAGRQCRGLGASNLAGEAIRRCRSGPCRQRKCQSPRMCRSGKAASRGLMKVSTTSIRRRGHSTGWLRTA